MRRPRPALPLLLAAVVAACGGSDGSTPSPSPTSSSGPRASAGSNPCTAALAGLGVSTSSRPPSPAKHGGLGSDDRDPRDFLLLHAFRGDGRVASRAEEAAAERIGDVTVLADDGTLLIAANPFDLQGTGLRFAPNPQGGYDVGRVDGSFRADLGRRLRLADDDTSEETMASPFAFYGRPRFSVFVNSDGNLTFDGGDTGTDARSLGRVLTGAPRVAPFFADLDPSAGGGIFVNASPDAFTVTWCEVPDYDATGKVTAQASLLSGGAVEIRIDASTTLKDAVVALSPGATGTFTGLDLSSAAASSAGGSGAVGERFAAEAALDLVAVSRRFYAEAADSYDQLVFWTDTRVTDSGTFAFETTVNNAVSGIGQEQVALADAYGSGGRLASLVVMDELAKYPADPGQRANGENTTLSLVAHETGHRWGATLQFREPRGAVADAWLGRQRAHWSFFCDSDASVLEGNDIEDQGGGSFRTAATVQRYGPFDLYAMGLLAESEVPPAFYVDNPSGASQDRESPPRTGVSFTGTRREVSIGDVVAAMGPRNPPASRAPRVHRQAWVYVLSRGRAADPAAIAKLDTIRRAFEGFFLSATGGRMSVETRLD